MKLWKRAGSVGLSLALCAGLVLPALAHTVTIDGGVSFEVDVVQEGVVAIESSTSKSGTITMTENETGSAAISQGNVTLDLSGHTLTGGDGIRVSGGGLTLQDTGPDGTGTVSGMDAGVKVDAGGTANITGGKVSGDSGDGVMVGTGGTATISGNATVSGRYGVASNGNVTILGSATVSGNSTGVSVGGGTANISGSATVSSNDTGVAVGKDGTVNITDSAVSGNSFGVSVMGSRDRKSVV